MSGQSDTPDFRARAAGYAPGSSTSRLDAIRQARAWLALEPLFLDTETTGLEPADQVIEICVLDHTGSVQLDTLVRPSRRISPGAGRVHGITDAQLQTMQTWAEVWPKLEGILAGKNVAIYNADFDVRLMRQSHRAHGLAWTVPSERFRCIMELYAQYFGQRDPRRGSFRWHRLEDAGRHCRIALPNSHRARADAMLARALLCYMSDSR